MNLILDTWIVDDEPLALELLEMYVNATVFLNLTGKFTSAKSVIQQMSDHTPDLVFLDIQMAQVNGIELARIMDTKTKIVFTTAFKKYALQGYGVNAIDYLLKPISYANFLTAARRALSWHQILQAKKTAVRPTNEGKECGVFVKSDYKIVHVIFEEVLYIQSLKNYIKIYTEKQRPPIVTLMSMKDIEEVLPKDDFIRIHRSFIVAKKKIKSINKRCIRIAQRDIPIGETYKETVLKEILL